MTGPLAGVRVLDVTVFQQGPQATLVMADMGADVIKLEPPGFGDLGRVLQRLGPQQVSAYHLAHSRGKRSVTVNLKTAEGRDLVRRLVPSADVFVHNFRPGVMERLGLGYEELRALNPRLVYAHASGWGTRGPKAEHPAFDIAAQARSGLMSMTGEEDGGPLPVGVAIADYIGAMNLALAVLAALYARDGGKKREVGSGNGSEGGRRREEGGGSIAGSADSSDIQHPASSVEGTGQKVETSLYGSAIASQAWELQTWLMGGAKRRGGRGHAYLPTIWRTFRTADGWAVVGGVGDDRWPAFCAAVSMPELEHDERFSNGLARAMNLAPLYELLDDAFASKTTAEWMSVLESHDMICAPVADYDALRADQQALANEYIIEVEHPTAGRVQVVGQPWRFSETPVELAAAAPELGQHTEEVLLEAGYSWAEIASLRAAGAV